ncbi:hypothetical protein [Parashewanella tropica]|uniref:hypothetical protein n=1 Tax=Parashewanella tropica TaxID=2547970 RepID=UPI001059A1FA|nr:hypothetical protein [Parashewanella tropica]
MSIDYAKYTLDELLDVERNIDRVIYPDRYQLLCDELAKRKQNGEYEQLQRELEDDEDYEKRSFVIEFSAEGSCFNRILFIASFFTANLIILGTLIDKYTVTNFSNLHQYTTQVDSARCKREKVVDDEGDTYNYFDLHIQSYEDRFSALSINQQKCRNFAKNLTNGINISIWHKDGLIYQLKQNDRMLLSYNEMKPKIWDLQVTNSDWYWLSLLLIWVLFFKSLVNAFSPGTYTQDD